MIISKRLQTIASYLPEHCETAADIGTDHGYLPIYAIKNGLSKHMIAMDVKEGPLQKAKRNIEQEGLSQNISLRLSDGFRKLKPGEADCAVISGMGGDLMARILEEGKDVAESLDRLILSPQSELFKVRGWLSDHSFDFLDEEMLIEDGKEYVIMIVKKGSGTELSRAELLFGPCLLRKGHPLVREKLRREQERRKRLSDGLREKLPEASIEKRLLELAQEENIQNEAFSLMPKEKPEERT